VNVTGLIQLLFDDISGASVYIKRLDLLHPNYGGNKWFKLKYNVEAALQSGCSKLVSFGGAHSNHLYALAHMGAVKGLQTIGIVRGEDPSGSTIETLKACGMQVVGVSRLFYAEKETEDFKTWIYDQFGLSYIIPEGGSNFLGINGCMEILSDEEKNTYSSVCCAAGTGATTAGLLLGCPKLQVVCIPVLKPESEMRVEITRHLFNFLGDDNVVQEYLQRLVLIEGYTFGGYARATPDLLSFITQFENQYDIPLDAIYTGKMCYAVNDLKRRGFFQPDEKVLMLHTGGLQGRICGDPLSYRT